MQGVNHGPDSNPGGWTNDLAASCGSNSVSTTCSSVIDENIDTPNDSDYIQSPLDPGVLASADFELADAPPDLVTLTEPTFRGRVSKQGDRTATVWAEVRKANGTIVAGVSFPLTTGAGTPATFSFTQPGLSLSAADVNGR